MFPENVKPCDGLQRPVQQIALIGRVQKDQVEFLPAAGQEGDGVPLDHMGLVLKAAGLDVLPDEGGGLPPLVGEGTALRAPGQGLQAKLTGAAEQVQHLPPLDVELDDVEQGLLHLVGGGTGVHALEFF